MAAPSSSAQAQASRLATERAPASSEMVYIYNAPESKKDTRYQYHIDVLKAALDATREQFGDYRLEPSAPMSESRQVSELKNATGAITVIIRGASSDYAELFKPVQISIDRGILGYRVLLIRQQDQPRFDEVNSLEDLKQFSIGQGAGWKDVDILAANGLHVVTGPSYDGLFEMLMKHRFDAFSRSVDEVGNEYDERKGSSPQLAIEQRLLLHYPIPRYFWFNPAARGQSLASRVEVGLRRIIDDGTLDSLFRKYFQARLEALNLMKRRLIELRNPYLPPNMPPQGQELPFDFRTVAP